MKHRKKETSKQRNQGTNKQEEQKHRNKETSEQRDQGTKKHTNIETKKQRDHTDASNSKDLLKNQFLRVLTPSIREIR